MIFLVFRACLAFLHATSLIIEVSYLFQFRDEKTDIDGAGNLSKIISWQVGNIQTQVVTLMPSCFILV